MEKKRRVKKSVIQQSYRGLIIFNIVFLLFLCGYYGYRLVYYYDLENHPTTEIKDLKSILTREENIVYAGDGLYPDGEGYRYIGKDVQNYVSYSGMLWRILTVNEDGSISLITEENVTSLVWGKDTNEFETSYVNTWLNPKDDVEHSGYFYHHLSNPKNFLVSHTTCVDVLSKPKEGCEKTHKKDPIGLLSTSDYLKAGGTKSYLNTGTYFWTSNGSKDGKVWYVFDKGGFNNLSSSGDNYYSYGIRPVITIHGNTALKGGNGTIDDPYRLEDIQYLTLHTTHAGLYVKYQDSLWRIVDVDHDKVKIVLEDTLKEGETPLLKVYSPTTNQFDPTAWNNIGFYLNHTYANRLNTEWLVEGNWYTGGYNTSTGFDYKKVYDSSVTASVGLLHMGELFLHDVRGYTTLTSSNDYEQTVITVNQDGFIYSELSTTELAMRPAVYLRGDLKITSGDGTKNNPLILGGAE